MARLERLYVPGCPHHIIQRGNNRQACFYTEKDYVFYLKQLSLSAEKFGVSIHAYVLMTNHVHLLVTPENSTSCGKMMQSLGRKFVRYINVTYQRTGTLWEGRYKSTLVDTENYFLAVSRYIEMNPVRARMVASPEEYIWSSFRENALGKPIGFIAQHAIYLALGKTRQQRLLRYRLLFDEVLDGDVVSAIRECTNKAWVLGSNPFKEEIKDTANRRIESSGWGGDRKSRSLTP